MAEDYAEMDAMEVLQRLKSEVFSDSSAELATGLGRPLEEVDAWLDGSEQIDEDAEMKIHGLAQERLGGE
jgi:hypothetical protein